MMINHMFGTALYIKPLALLCSAFSLYITTTLLIPHTAQAGGLVRIMGGVGTTNTDIDFEDMDKSNSHWAIQLLNTIPNDDRQRGWGIELGHHNVFTSNDIDFEYTSFGIIVESRLFASIKGQLGTVGYFPKHDSDSNPVGLRLSLGMDHTFSKKSFFWSWRVRQDIILEDERILAGSIEAGLGTKF